MHFLPTGNKLLTTFLGKAAKIRVAKRPSRTLPVIQAIVLATATEEMNIEFGKRISEMVVSETLSSSSSAHSAHASTAIPIEEIFCDAKMQHVEHATEARENIQKMLLSSALSKIQQMPLSTTTISKRYEMYTSARERMAMMQHIWGLSFQDKSDCEEVSVLTTTLMQGMVGAYYLTEKYSNEIAKLRLKLECKDEATWNES